MMTHCSIASSRHGGLGLYAIILILLGLGLATFVFLPEYNEVQNSIYNLSCDDIRNQIQTAVDDYNINNSKSCVRPNAPVDLKHLQDKGYLREIKNCPQRGDYLFNREGKVICSIHVKGQSK